MSFQESANGKPQIEDPIPVYREIISNHPEVVPVLILLSAMNAFGHSAADVLKIIRTSEEG